MADEIPPLLLLAAASNLLIQEIERSEHQHLAGEELKHELRAFMARVEAELDAAEKRRHLHLADDSQS